MLRDIYLVGTSIGNHDDISPRARAVLASCDAILVEEEPTGRRLLDQLGLGATPLYEVNEHNEESSARTILTKLFTTCNRIALISDAGMPVLADPGRHVIREAIAMGIRIHSVPGPSSILAALQLSALPTDHFYYAGFLPRQESARRARLARLRHLETTLVILETPYRLGQLLASVKATFPPDTPLALCFNLTLPTEEVFRGTVAEAAIRFPPGSKHGPFVLVLGNNRGNGSIPSQSPRRRRRRSYHR